MSRDGGAVELAIARAVRRARLVAAAEAAAAGVTVAAWSLAAGFVLALALAVWRGRRALRSRVVRAIERAHPASRNVLLTADEISSGAIGAKEPIRQRVLADAAALASSIDIRRAVPATRAWQLGILACASWIGISLVHTASEQAATSGARRVERATAGGAAALHITAVVEPPAYAGLRTETLSDPAQIDALQNSVLRLAIRSSAADVKVETADGTRALNGVNGSFEYRTVLERAGYLLVTAADGGRRLIPVTVKPDALPSVQVVAPGKDLVYEAGNPTIAFRAHATDDFGVRALTLRYTKVSGSGEQFEFTDGEIPLTIDADDPRDWTGRTSRSLSQLELREGDMLVYRAVATDARPGGGEASSDAFFIEVSRLGVAAGDAFTLPQEETRYALSQQMLIVKTERLNQRRSAMTATDVLEQSQGLAVEQRMIRSEFVFMLGGEIEDEEVEAEQSVELQAGRLANRGQRDLRAATIAMSQAEKLLTDARPADALAAERAAVAALQRAFARDRYILRALATRDQLDPSRRLTGKIGDAVGWRRQTSAKTEDRRAARLLDLLHSLGEASPQTDRNAVGVLAAFAIRIDAQSAVLRRAAEDLQKLGDQWPTLDAPARARAIDAVAASVATEARSALADPPASALSGRVGARR